MPARAANRMTARYQAVIFDMDGVLVDSEPAFFAAFNDVVGRLGKHIDWEDYQGLLGTSTEVTQRALTELLGLEGDPAGNFRGFDDALLKHLGEPRDPLPGAVSILDELSRRDVPYALATSSIQSWKDAVLTSAGLGDRFDAAVTADMIEHTKPAPDIYLLAAELLGVEPERCIAVEDTPPGIASAKAAGMYAIQVRASSTAFPPIAQADQVIDTLESFPFQLLDA